MDNKQEVPYSGRIERTRRNIVAMGGIAASALFASLASATKARAAEVLIEQLVINGDTIDVYNDGKTDNITVTGNINEQLVLFLKTTRSQLLRLATLESRYKCRRRPAS